MVETLPPQDAVLWWVQTPDAPLQIGALCVFEGPPLRDASGVLRIDALRRHAAVQLQHTPRFRQVILRLPLDQGLAWVDDEDFDPAHHIRTAALPHPGGDAQLRELVNELLERPLDPTRPLWGLWLVDGLSDDRVALLVKASHVMVDGMALLELALRLLDAAPCDHDEAPPRWTPSPRPAGPALLAAGVLGRMRRAALGMWQAAGLATQPRVLGAMASTVRRVATRDVAMAPVLPMNRPIGRHRDFAWLHLSMADLLTVKRATGVTVNDVVLAIVAGATARYLSTGPAAPAVGSPRALVPVSVHGAVAAQEVQNRFSMMVAELPLHIADPLERLRALHDQMERAKRSAQTSLAGELFPLVDLLPSWLVRLGGPPILRRQPLVNIVVTNLPGARDDAYLLGARLLGAYPFVTGTGNLAVIIGVLSHADGLGVGITVDPDVVDDVDALAAGFEPALRELVAAVQ